MQITIPLEKKELKNKKINKKKIKKIIIMNK